MIVSRSRGLGSLLRICKVRGSVLPASFLAAVLCATLTAALEYATKAGHIGPFAAEDSILKDNAAWAGFSFLAGLFILLRSSQSYSRFLEACTSTHQMRGDLFDACSALLAFCKHSKANQHLISSFQNTCVRLCSMLHAAALGEIEDSCTKGFHRNEGANFITALKLELLDVEGIDEDSLQVLKQSNAKAELIFQWLQLLIVENIKTGVLSIPGPILSRSFQAIERGMLAFNQAKKLSRVQYPFPYAQTCDVILMLHWLLTPFVVSQWVSQCLWAGIFSFAQVFILWTLNFIAVELESPFGMAANDIDGHGMQLELNNQLLLLLRPSTQRIPKLNQKAFDLCAPETHTPRGYKALQQKSFSDAWQSMSSSCEAVDACDAVAHPFEKSAAFSGADNKSSTAHQPKVFYEGSISEPNGTNQDLLSSSPRSPSVVLAERDASPERLEEGKSSVPLSMPKVVCDDPEEDPHPLLLPRSAAPLSVQAPHAFFASCRTVEANGYSDNLMHCMKDCDMNGTSNGYMNGITIPGKSCEKWQSQDRQQDSPCLHRELTRATSSDEIDGVSLQRENTRLASIEEMDTLALQPELTRASSSDDQDSWSYVQREVTQPNGSVQDGFPFLHQEFMRGPCSHGLSSSAHGNPCKL